MEREEAGINAPPPHINLHLYGPPEFLLEWTFAATILGASRKKISLTIFYQLASICSFATEKVSWKSEHWRKYCRAILDCPCTQCMAYFLAPRTVCMISMWPLHYTSDRVKCTSPVSNLQQNKRLHASCVNSHAGIPFKSAWKWLQNFSLLSEQMLGFLFLWWLCFANKLFLKSRWRADQLSEHNISCGKKIA